MAVEVSRGSIIQAVKTWKNVGDTGGARDVMVAYGVGTTLESFVSEFGTYVGSQHCNPGSEAVAYLNLLVPAGAALGLRNALVGVGSYDPGNDTGDFDVHEIVPDAIEVVEPAPTKVSITVNNKNVPEAWAFTTQLYAGWNMPAYKGETTTVEKAIESIASYVRGFGYYVGDVWHEYAPTDTIAQGTAVWIDVSQHCVWGMPPLATMPYWVGLTNISIGSCPFTPIGQDFFWTVYPNELVAFIGYDGSYTFVDFPNAGQFIGWGNFIDGNTYTWNFDTGVLEGTFA